MTGLVTPTMIETVSGIFIDLADPKPADINIHDIAWALSRQARYAGHTMCRSPYTVAQHTVQVSRYVQEALTPGEHLHGVFMRYIQTQLNHFYNQPTPQVTQVEKWAQFEGRAQDASNDLVAAFTFHGLMHDFAEAYLVDLPTPVKRLPGIYEAYKAHEAKMDALIYETLGLPYSSEKFLENWEFGKMIVGWADMYALLVEAYHFMPSRGLNWGIPLERPDLSALYNFRWPISNEQAYEELLDRYEELVLSQHMKLLYKYSI